MRLAIGRRRHGGPPAFGTQDFADWNWGSALDF